jgi:SAM-dependent methyltransferase
MPGTGKDPAGLAGHPDRERWNARYADGRRAAFEPHRLAVQALGLPLPDRPVADLACGRSGSALLAAASGRLVTAVDISDVALTMLAEEARRRGLTELITLVDTDLPEWRPEPGGYALVLCTGYWDRSVFTAAALAVADGGLIGWESLTTEARRVRPGLSADWCLQPGEPATLLPPGYIVLESLELPGEHHLPRRSLLARRSSTATPGTPG